MTIAKKSVSESAVKFAWADESINTFDLSELSPELITRAALHGLSQKLGDSYSGIKSVAEAQDAALQVWKAMKEGDWNRKGESSGGIWVEAFAKASGKDYDLCLVKWNSLSDEEKKVLKADDRLKQAKAEIELAKLKVKAAAAGPLEFLPPRPRTAYPSGECYECYIYTRTR